MSDQDDGWKEVMDWAKQADTDRDPLSDEAFREWWHKNPSAYAGQAWQECARRAREDREAMGNALSDATLLNKDLASENKLLRDLLIECAEYLERDKHVGMPRKIRAALEGKE